MRASAAMRSILTVGMAVALLAAAIAPPGQVRALQSAKGSYCLMGMDSGTRSMANGCLTTYRQCQTFSKDCCETINKVGGTRCLGGSGSGGRFTGDNYGVADDLNLNFKNICAGTIDYIV